ncbi:MAG: hypothetical protein AB7K04_16325 [Pseudorhodoplanes sp.]
MAYKQDTADKAKALREYQDKHDMAVKRIATLRAARLARDAENAPADKPKTSRKNGQAQDKQAQDG